MTTTTENRTTFTEVRQAIITWKKCIQKNEVARNLWAKVVSNECTKKNKQNVLTGQKYPLWKRIVLSLKRPVRTVAILCMKQKKFTEEEQKMFDTAMNAALQNKESSSENLLEQLGDGPTPEGVANFCTEKTYERMETAREEVARLLNMLDSEDPDVRDMQNMFTDGGKHFAQSAFRTPVQTIQTSYDQIREKCYRYRVCGIPVKTLEESMAELGNIDPLEPPKPRVETPEVTAKKAEIAKVIRQLTTAMIEKLNKEITNAQNDEEGDKNRVTLALFNMARENMPEDIVD